MLDQILRAFSNFESKHQFSANVLDINHRQFQILQKEYPMIFGPEAKIELGFHICLHREHDQPNPSVRRMGSWYEAPSAWRKYAQLLENQGKKIVLKTGM